MVSAGFGTLLSSFIVIFLLGSAVSQQLRGRGKRGNNKGNNGDNSRSKENVMLRALTVNYPLHFFDAAHADVDWRKSCSL
jgi:hypothetical protein